MNAVSVTVVAAFAIPLVFYVKTADPFYTILFCSMIAANTAVEGIKPLLGKEGIYGRPAGATACDAFCVGGPVGGRPGFPSGHMTTVTMLLSALWWHTRSPAVLWIGVPWTCAMAWSRWAKQCHNWQQIAAGVATGSLFGYLLTRPLNFWLAVGG